MITIFNRRELLSTFSLQQQGQVRDALDALGIPHRVKVISRSSPALGFGSRERTGSFGENPELAYEHIIYVRKKDYDTALRVLK